MKVWDLHCDTLYRLLGREDTAGEPAVEAFAKDGGMLDLAKMRAGIICCNVSPALSGWRKAPTRLFQRCGRLIFSTACSPPTPTTLSG